MDALKWAIDNKTWLFSGAGVAAITAIFSFLLWMIKKPKNVQHQSGGFGSRNIQAGRDVNITEGRADFLQLKRIKLEASARFRSAFAEAITQMTNGSKDPHYLISQHKGQHDAAIFEFRHFVDPARLSDFDAAVENYRECRNALKPALHQVLQSEVTGNPIDQLAGPNVIGAINRLLAFADNPQI